MDPGTIIAGIGAISSLFGGNGAQRDANRLKQRELDLQDRQIGNYEKYAAIGQGYREQGAPYLAQQGQAYQKLGQAGSADRQNAMGLLAQLYPQYAGVSGVSGIQFPSGGQPTSNTSPNYNRTPQAGQTAADVLNNRNQAPAANPQAQGQQGQPQTPQDMYGLTLPQQEQLNQRIDTIRTQEASAIEEYRAALAQQGLPPNPAGESRIRESLGSLANQERSTFAENARQERSKALMNLIGFALGDKAEGTSLMGQEAAGYGNVAQGYNSYAQSALGQGESGPYAQIAAQAGQQSQWQTQRSDDFMSTLGQLLPFLQGLSSNGTTKKQTWQEKYQGAV